ncbi:unnamed protein product [Chondrus crispus]|uniref:SOUL heme-binding protein n=1 Tax=Chondrus crispus TaxID=2769 RepID=R7Q9S6_CHOCR|nr:unnamed protein product [Chondrus crispus]CDF35292.1 unnamed protein product [Chondrus crispus]|eukprot:XP_005715111.1 unnamed protein product [Chondrus crispus]
MGGTHGIARTETPAHTVLQGGGRYEVWRYPSSVAAVVRVTDVQRAATDRAFRDAAFSLLARYIGVFSRPHNATVGNRPEKIAMTSPVVMTPGAHERTHSMRFLLPSRYRSVEEAPAPTDAAVKLEMAPAGRVEAVLRFSGNMDMGVAAQRAAELGRLLEEDGLKPTGAWIACAYDPPFMPPMMKRNEVHFPLDPKAFPTQQGGK